MLGRRAPKPDGRNGHADAHRAGQIRLQHKARRQPRQPDGLLFIQEHSGQSNQALAPDFALNLCNWHAPRPETPRKGRPAALVSSPFPEREARREKGEGAKRLRGMPPTSSGAQPVTGIERAAHAQRHRRNIDQFVGRHLFGGVFCLDRDTFDIAAGAAGAARSLVRPFCLAGGCRTGYRKE